MVAPTSPVSSLRAKLPRSAHRAGVPGARVDEAFWECGDWDFVLSLTEERNPLQLPAVAVYHRTDGDERLTGRHPDHEQAVRDKWVQRRAEREAGGSIRGSS